MYCKYVYKPGATFANFAADLALLLCGETNLANLSAQCDLSTSELITTVAADWSLHDAAPGGDYQVLKAPWADGLGYKYAKVGALWDGSSASNVAVAVGYESWDAVGHSGSGKVYLSDQGSYAQRLDTSNGGRLHLFASPRMIMMLGETQAPYYLVGGSTFSGPSGLFEHERRMPWCTAANHIGPWGWTNFAWTGGNGSGFNPVRCKKRATGTLETDCTIAMGVPGGLGILPSMGTGYPEVFLDDAQSLSTQMYPIVLTSISWNTASNGGVSGYYGDLSGLCDCWGILSGSLSMEDTFTYNQKTYVALLSGGTVCMVARKE